jgi:branched-chain amino acid transport system ATP-binding protein
MISERFNAFVLVEQHVEVALPLTEQVIVLERGRIVHRGPSAELLSDHAALERLVGLRLADV